MRFFNLFERRVPEPPRPRAPRRAARPRDSQRARLYRAERAFFMRDSACPHAAYGWLPRIEEVRRFVRHVATMPAVVRAFPHPVNPGASLLDGLEVTDGRGRRSAASYLGRHAIAVPVALRMRWVVVHECAHVVTRARCGDGAAGHGPEFAAHYLLLAEAVFGADAAAGLAASFTAHGVRHRF